MLRRILARSSTAGVALLLWASVASAAVNNPPPAGQWCYTTTYSASGAIAKTDWYPCGPASPLWTMNQAQSTIDITPSNGVTFTPTKAIFTQGTSGNAACVLVAKLVNDTATHTFTNIQPGLVYPFQVIDIEATSTTCTGIEGLY